MKKFTVNIPDEAHERLKEYAKKDMRSLTTYVELWLAWIAVNPYKPAPSPLYIPALREIYKEEENKNAKTDN